MCLSIVNKIYTNEEIFADDTIYHGWKHMCYYPEDKIVKGIVKQFYYELDEWYIFSGSKISAGYNNSNIQRYPAGFHIYKTREIARKYSRYNVVKVYYQYKFAEGIQSRHKSENADCIISPYLMVPSAQFKKR